MSYNNKFIKVYEEGPVPTFTYSELEALQKDETLNPFERSEFRRVYSAATFEVQCNGADVNRIYALVRPESGVLAFFVSDDILIHNNNEAVISKEELAEMAFDTTTPESLSSHYKEVLIRARKMIRKYKADWYRIIFLKNVYTNKVHIYFD